MNNFFNHINLEPNLVKKLTLIEATVLNKTNNTINIVLESSNFLNEKELSHLLTSIKKSKLNINLEKIKILQPKVSKSPEEIYSYFILINTFFSNDIFNYSNLFVRKTNDVFEFVATHKKEFQKLTKIASFIFDFFKNISLLKENINVVFEEIIEKKINAENIINNIAESKNNNIEIDNKIRHGFTKLNFKNKDEQKNVYFQGELSSIDYRTLKSRKTKKDLLIVEVIVGDYENAISGICWKNNSDSKFEVKQGDLVRVYGNYKYDTYYKDYRLNILDSSYSIQKLNKNILNTDNIDIKNMRSELHAHTKMSYMDGVASVADYIDVAFSKGIKAISINDHDSVQAFPEAFNYLASLNNEKKIKLIYGSELSVYDDVYTKIVWNEKNKSLQNQNYVFFDLETTGISPLINEIIEIGAVRSMDGSLVNAGNENSKFQTFVDPGFSIPKHITELTNIKNSDVKGAPKIKEALIKFRDWIGDSILVAHNAKFDLSFLNYHLQKNGIKKINNVVIDTLSISRLIHPKLKSHTLGSISKIENVVYNEMISHRADYDAEVLSKVYENLLHKLLDMDIRNIMDINKNLTKIYNYLFPIHINVLVKNQKGIKDLYQLISDAHTLHFSKERDRAFIPLSKLLKNRKNLLLGSSCYEGIVWNETNYSLENLEEIYKYFDFIEIFPVSAYKYLVESSKYTEKEIIKILQIIINNADKYKIPIVGTSNAHYVKKEDKLIRDIYIYNKGLKGRRHPLYYWKNKNITSPDHHLRGTSEMLIEFEKIVNATKAREIVIKNSNKISDLIDDNIKPLHQKLCPPNIKNAEKEFTDLIKKNLKEKYGSKPNEIIIKRLKKELDLIIKHKFTIVYYLSALAVNQSLKDGYLVGSRGSVGSSLVATLSNITEVNPLPPHYICNKCKYHEFNNTVDSGFDLKNKECPLCKNIMKGDGHNIPFETFLGFDGEKIPDIDLNFAREYQLKIHKFIKDFIGEKNVYRAGTISTVANRTAFGYIKHYLEEKNIENSFSRAKISFLSKKVEGTKRTTGQHPGGLIILPEDMDITDFTPINFPGNDTNSEWKTTHFDFHSIHDDLLKLDLLGHLDPSSVRMLEKLTKISALDIPMNDKKVLDLFSSNKVLNIKLNYLEEKLGIIGIPEFGTNFVRQLVRDAKPTSFADLIRLSGLSHGTFVWNSNGKDLVLKDGKKLSELVSTRDDIMTYLISKNINNSLSFNIMEKVRKGKGLTTEEEKIMYEHNVPQWYINSCKKIKYIFPKAHATAYVIMAFRIAWYKINYPLEYYVTFFTKRDTEWDYISLMDGYKGVKAYIEKIKALEYKATDKELSTLETYNVVLEMFSREITIEKILINSSLATEWTIDKKNNKIIPPFIIIDGLGEAVAKKIVEERKKANYISTSDFATRSGVNKTILEFFKNNKILEELDNEQDFKQLTINF